MRIHPGLGADVAKSGRSAHSFPSQMARRRNRAVSRRPTSCLDGASLLALPRPLASKPTSREPASPSDGRRTGRKPRLLSRPVSEKPAPTSGVQVKRSPKADKP